MTTTINATTAYRAIKTHAEEIKNDELQRVETCSVGDAWAQGDVLLVCLEAVPQGAERVKTERQLAPGTSQGSRHLLDALGGIVMYRLPNPTPLDGPVIEAERRFVVTHPEHGDISLPAGVWGVVYQRQFAEELRRVAD